MHQDSNFVDHQLKEIVPHGTAILPIQIYLDQQINDRISLYTHWHDKIELLVCRSGSFELTIENETLLVQAGDYIIINQAHLHSASPIRGQNSTHDALIFDLQLLSSAHYDLTQSQFLEPLLTRAWLFPQKLDPTTAWGQRCAQEIDEIFSYYTQQRFGWELSVKANVLKVITILLLENQFVHVLDRTVSDEKANIIKRVLDYLQQHAHEKITLHELAALANLSPEYFCRFFKEYTGTTAIAYLHQVRIEQATKLLLETDTSILTISLQVGFDDHSYFSKKFKAVKGLTPAKFRQAHRQS